MQPVSRTIPRDPAPSRLAYRAHRLWLTPMVRVFVRLGLPAFVAVTAFGWYFGQAENRDWLMAQIADIRRSVEERPEFMVQAMAIDGASGSIADDIREVVPVDFPISSFDLDLQGMRDRIAELDAVARVDVRVRSGGILQVDVTERVPVAVWRMGRDLELLDAEGHRVAAINSRMDRADLPVLAGLGAERAVPEAMTLMTAAEPILPRLRGMVRVGERRWDMVLDRDQVIRLPESGAVPALEQVIALDQAQDLLQRAVLVVDMRNPARPTMRLGSEALEEIETIRLLATGAER